MVRVRRVRKKESQRWNLFKRLKEQRLKNVECQSNRLGFVGDESEEYALTGLLHALDDISGKVGFAYRLSVRKKHDTTNNRKDQKTETNKRRVFRKARDSEQSCPGGPATS